MHVRECPFVKQRQTGFFFCLPQMI